VPIYRYADRTLSGLTTGLDLLTGTNTIPQFVVELALGYNPGDASPVYTDVSTYLRSFHITRGRQYELNQMQAGTCDITLKNLDRRFDPTYSSSPYYPYLRPMVPVRISAVFQAVTYRLFTGYVERFPQNRTGPTYAETQVQAVDGFELLTNAVLPGDSYPLELSGARVTRVLDAVNWSATARSISAGQSQVIAYTFGDIDFVQPLSHLQDVTTSELGNFFMAKDGSATFRDRYTTIATTSLGVFTDQPSVDTGDIGYSELQKSFDKDLIFNDWRGTRSGGSVVQEALDSISTAKYSLRPQARTPLLPDDLSTMSQMQSLLNAYKEPSMRVSQITVTPGNTVAAWSQVPSRELLDRVTTREHPPGGGAPFVQDSLIQQIDLSVDKDAVAAKCVYTLLQADPTAYLILNDATSGTIDSTNKLGY
jgi:hypothetical protein